MILQRHLLPKAPVCSIKSIQCPCLTAIETDNRSNSSLTTDGDPNNYLSYYRRATVYLALGRSRPGLQDLDEVIRLKPDFTAARAQRGGVLVKLGRLEEAHIDLENVVIC